MHSLRFVRLAPFLMALTPYAVAVTDYPDAARDSIRSNPEKTHVQFPLHCPECFSSLVPEDQEYLECDLQIVPPRGGEAKPPAFMFNGHYIPESQFESQSESRHSAELKGISETSGMAKGHKVSGMLQYETIRQEGDVDIKGVQLNLSKIQNGKTTVSYGLRMSYARSPIPQILRIAEMDVADDPFADVDDWATPPQEEEFSSDSLDPPNEDFVYGVLKNYGHECDMTSCRAHDFSGLVSDRFSKFKGDMSERIIKFRAECDDIEGKKPLHCRVYEHKGPSALVVIGLLILMIFVMRRTCRACCVCLLSRGSVGLKSEQASVLGDTSHGKEV